MLSDRDITTLEKLAAELARIADNGALIVDLLERIAVAVEPPSE